MSNKSGFVCFGENMNSKNKKLVLCLVKIGFQLNVEKYRILCLVKIGFQLDVEQIGFCLFWGEHEFKKQKTGFVFGENCISTGFRKNWFCCWGKVNIEQIGFCCLGKLESA